jgi:hypothetical protein
LANSLHGFFSSLAWHAIARELYINQRNGMKILRIVIASAVLAMVAFTWQLGSLPGWIAVPSAAALLIWGLDLDWRRKKGVADARAATRERDTRRAEKQRDLTGADS